LSFQRLLQLSPRWALLFILLAGLALRLWLLVASQQLLEADEALVGLQAFSILRGERPLFYPGQSYLASVESYEAALLFLFAGASPFTLKLVPLAASLAFILSTFYLAQALYTETVGLVSALLAALSPLIFTTLSLKAYGGYVEIAVLGNVALLLLLRLTCRTRPAPGPRAALGLAIGLLSGAAFLIHPLYVYYLAPIGLVLLVKIRRTGWEGLLTFVVGMLIGLLPWISNLGANSGSWVRFLEPIVPRESQPAVIRQALDYFVGDGLLTMWGLRPLKGPLVVTPWFAIIPLYLAALAYLLWCVGRDAWRRKLNPAWVLVAFLLFAPAVFSGFATIKGNFAAIIPGSGLLIKYTLPFYSLWPLLLAALLVDMGRRWLPIGAALTALLLLTNGASHLAVEPVVAMRGIYENVPLPASNRDLIGFLESERIEYVYVDHWIGYRIMFESGERVVAYDWVDAQRGMDRLPRYGALVEKAASPPAFILFNPQWPQTPPFENALKALGVIYRKKELPSYLVYYDFSRRVHPSEMRQTLEWPYYE